MLTLAFGSSSARAISILSVPIITRIYSPSEYGLLALYVSTISILSPAATLRYGTAIPLPKTDVFAINIFALGLVLLSLYSFILVIVLYFFGEIIFLQFNMVELQKWWWLIVLGVVGSATYELLNSWATRKKKFQIMARTQFTQSVIGNGTKILLGVLGYKSFGLIFGQFLNQSSGSIGLTKTLFTDFKVLRAKVSIKKLKFASRYYRQFPFFRLPSQLLLTISSNGPILIMSSIYSKDLTGQLSLAIMAISLPTGIISQAISSAFYAEISRIGRRNLKKIKQLTLDIQKRLFLIGIPITILIYFLAEPVFNVIFGLEWKNAGKYASILAPYVLLQFTSSTLVQVLNITGSQLSFLMLNIVRILGLIIIYAIFKYNTFESDSFVYALSGYLSMFYIYQTIFVLKSIK